MQVQKIILASATYNVQDRQTGQAKTEKLAAKLYLSVSEPHLVTTAANEQALAHAASMTQRNPHQHWRLQELNTQDITEDEMPRYLLSQQKDATHEA